MDQLLQLAQDYVKPAIKSDAELPNDQINSVTAAAGNSVVEGLQSALRAGKVQDILALFQQGNISDNPLTSQISGIFEQRVSDLNIQGMQTQGFSASVIPALLEGLVGKSKSGTGGFDLSALLQSIGGSGNSQLMDLVNQYGGQFGLDQNGDGKVDMQDAITAISGKSNKGGLGGLLGKMFGK